MERSQIFRNGQKYVRRGVKTIIVHIFYGKGVVAWTSGNSAGRLLKQPALRPFIRGGRVLGLVFAGCVPLASQSLYPIIVYSVAIYRPHLSHLRANM